MMGAASQRAARFGRSLRWRLFGLSLATLIVALLMAGFGLAGLFTRHVERRAFAELENHSRTLLASLEVAADGTLQQTALPADPLFATPYGGLYWQFIENGKPVLRSRSLWDFVIDPPPDELPGGAVHQHRLVGPDRATLLALERPLRLGEADNVRDFRLVVAIDRKFIAAAITDFNRDLVLALGGLAIVLLGASIVQAGIGLAPLSRLRERLIEVRAGAHARLAGDVPLEVRPLIDEINGLLDQRDATIARARTRAADLAHGLKTPLTVLDGAVRRLHDLRQTAIADEIGNVSAMMARHVQAELSRARIAGARDAPGRFVRARPAIEAIVAVMACMPEGGRLVYDIDVDPNASLAMDAGDFDEVMGNLIENAVRHARHEVRVSINSQPEEQVVSVADDGAGIAAEDKERLLQRGQSGDTRGSGAGLGLSIVNDVLEAYDARLRLGSSQSGGLLASFTLPLSS